jgi:dolichyl-phosphate beta-glucosyltransferase
VLMMAQRRGYRIVEVPVNWTHQPGSKVNLVTDSARMLRDLFVIRGHYLKGEYNRPHVAPRLTPTSNPRSQEPETDHRADLQITPSPP